MAYNKTYKHKANKNMKNEKKGVYTACTECQKEIPKDVPELYNKIHAIMSVRVCEDCHKPE